MEPVTFSEGIFLNKVSEKAPEWIKASVSIHVKTAIDWLNSLEHKGLIDEKGYVKLTGKESKAGKRYFQVDTWKPTKTEDNDAPPF